MHHIVHAWLKMKSLSADCTPHMAFILEDCRGSTLHSLALSPRVVINYAKHQSLSCTGAFCAGILTVTVQDKKIEMEIEIQANKTGNANTFGLDLHTNSSVSCIEYDFKLASDQLFLSFYYEPLGQ